MALVSNSQKWRE